MTPMGRWVREGSTVSLLDVYGGEPPTAAELPAGFRRRRRLRLVSDELDQESGARPMLRSGSRGPDVVELQRRLATLGYSPGPADGMFGPQTASAVQAFQRASRLLVDGIVGPQTWAALDGVAMPAPTQPAPVTPTQPYRPGAGAVRLQVPFRGYQSNDKAGCFRRSSEMAAAVGAQVGGPDVRIQIATRENSQGRIVIDPARAREGVAYIDQTLSAGYPVVVGVSYMDSDYNVDDITDHFVIITGRDREADGDLFYCFHDPASSSQSKGGDQNPANRFYLGPDNMLFRPSSSLAPLGSHIYDVAMVRRNL